MLHPELLPPAIRSAALAGAADELDPINLFNITWRGPDNQVRHVVLPGALTGVRAHIVVLVGRHFPSGSHKVGPAYSTMMEGELAGETAPGEHTMIGPSTGNFGIGVASIQSGYWENPGGTYFSFVSPGCCGAWETNKPALHRDRKPSTFNPCRSVSPGVSDLPGGQGRRPPRSSALSEVTRRGWTRSFLP
ncbi:MAG TPA: hypothetical protein VNY05_12035 [Candidatus Acidoferrales bacterium]|jgi:hypothetical protein|nr:hypothetical protein [Candidatus Acidoferrales bacterium]